MVRCKEWEKKHDRWGDIGKVHWLEEFLLRKEWKSEGNGHVIQI